MSPRLTVVTAVFLFVFVGVVTGFSLAGRDVEIDGTVGGILIVMAGATFISREEISRALASKSKPSTDDRKDTADEPSAP